MGKTNLAEQGICYVHWFIFILFSPLRLIFFVITEKGKIYKLLSVAMLDYQCRYKIALDEMSAYFSFSYYITCDYRAKKNILKYDQVKSYNCSQTRFATISMQHV